MSENYILISEPIKQGYPDDVREWLKKNYSESNLARAYADVHNEVGYLRDEYDKDLILQQVADKWWELEVELYQKIYSILSDENTKKNANHDLSGGMFPNAKPFMHRNGYIDGGGWWIKEMNA